MAASRFILLRAPAVSGVDTATLSWLLVSSNNRPLGRGRASFDSPEACKVAVSRLREDYHRVVATAWSVDGGGHWVWRADLDGLTVALATRTYLRHRECDYNLARFLDAVPRAEVAPAVRVLGARR